jgi:hypothetical protein
MLLTEEPSDRSRDLVEACWGKKWDEAVSIIGGDAFDARWADAEGSTALHWGAPPDSPLSVRRL